MGDVAFLGGFMAGSLPGLMLFPGNPWRLAGRRSSCTYAGAVGRPSPLHIVPTRSLLTFYLFHNSATTQQ